MRSLLLAPLLLLPILLGGCAESDVDAADSEPPAPSRSASAATTTTTTATAAPTSGASGGPSGGGAQPSASASSGGGSGLPATKACGGPSLDITLYTTDASAGSTDYTIAFTNRGRAVCHVSGAPLAYLIGEDGDRLGAEASGAGQEGAFVRVPPGESAYADVRVVRVGTDGGPLAGRCTTRKAVAIAVDAPNYDRYEQVPVTTRGCVEQDVQALSVSVLRGGS